MSRPLRVVKPGEPHGDMTMQEALQEAFAKLVAAQPVAVLIAFEPQGTPDGPGKLQFMTLPMSFTLACGFAGELYNKLARENVPQPDED